MAKKIPDYMKQDDAAQAVRVKKMQDYLLAKGEISAETALKARNPVAAAQAAAAPTPEVTVDATPELKWDTKTLTVGQQVYFNPQTYTFTGVSGSNLPVYKTPDGSPTVSNTGTSLKYNAWLMASIAGKVDIDSPVSVGAINPGDRLYYDVVTNKYTNKPSDSTIGMYYTDLTGDYDAYLKSQGQTQGLSSMSLRPNEVPDDFVGKWEFGDNDGQYSGVQGKQPLIATAGLLTKLTQQYAQAKELQEAKGFTTQGIIDQKDWNVESPLTHLWDNPLTRYVGSLITGKKKFDFADVGSVLSEFNSDISKAFGSLDVFNFARTLITRKSAQLSGDTETIYGQSVTSGTPGLSMTDTMYYQKLVKEGMSPTEAYQKAQGKNAEKIGAVQAIEIDKKAYLNMMWLMNVPYYAGQGLLSKEAIRVDWTGNTGARWLNLSTPTSDADLMRTFADSAPGVVDYKSALAYLEKSTARQNELVALVQARPEGKVDDLIKEMTDIYRGQEYARTFIDNGMPLTLTLGFWNQPVRYQTFLETRARFELEHNRPMNRAELMSLQQQYVNPVVEFQAQVTMDPINLLDFISAAPIIMKFSQLVQKTKYAETFLHSLTGLNKLVHGAEAVEEGDDAIQVARRVLADLKPGARTSGVVADVERDMKKLTEMAEAFAGMSPEELNRFERSGSMLKSGEMSLSEFMQLKSKLDRGVRNTPSSREYALVLNKLEQDVHLLQNTKNMGPDAIFDAINQVKYHGELYSTTKDGRRVTKAFVAPVGDSLSLGDMVGQTVLKTIFGPIVYGAKGTIKLTQLGVKGLEKLATVLHMANVPLAFRMLFRESRTSMAQTMGRTMHALIDEVTSGSARVMGHADMIASVKERISLVYDNIDVIRSAFSLSRDDGRSAMLKLLGSKDGNLGRFGASSVLRLVPLSSFFSKDELFEALDRAVARIEVAANEEFAEHYASLYTDPALAARAAQDYVQSQADKPLRFADAMREEMQHLFNAKTTTSVPAGYKSTKVTLDDVFTKAKISFPTVATLFNGASTVYDKLMDLWKATVLGRRPAWVVFNMIESVFRGLFAYGNPFGFSSYYFKPMAQIMDAFKAIGLPYEDIQSFMSTRHTSLFDEDTLRKGLVRSAKDLAKDSWDSAVKEYWKDGIPLGGRIKGMVYTPINWLQNMITGTNSLFEQSVRLRFTYMLFDQNLKKVYPEFARKFKVKLEKELAAAGVLPSEMGKYMRAASMTLELTHLDPLMFRDMMNISDNVRGAFLGSLLLPQKVVGDSPFADTFGENRIFLQAFMHEIADHVDEVGLDTVKADPTKLDDLFKYAAARLEAESADVLRPDLVGQVVDIIMDVHDSPVMDELVTKASQEADSLIIDLVKELLAGKNFDTSELKRKVARFLPDGDVSTSYLDAVSRIQDTVVSRAFTVDSGKMEKIEADTVAEAVSKLEDQHKASPNWQAEKVKHAELTKTLSDLREWAKTKDAKTLSMVVQVDEAYDVIYRDTYYKIKEWLLNYAPGAPFSDKFASKFQWEAFRRQDEELALRLVNKNDEIISTAKRMMTTGTIDTSLADLKMQDMFHMAGVTPIWNKERTKISGFRYNGVLYTDDRNLARLVKQFNVRLDLTPEQYLAAYMKYDPVSKSHIPVVDDILLKTIQSPKEAVLAAASQMKTKIDILPASFDDFVDANPQFMEMSNVYTQQMYLLNKIKYPTAVTNSKGGIYYLSPSKRIVKMMQTYNPEGSLDKIEDVYKAIQRYQEINVAKDLTTLRDLQYEAFRTEIVKTVDVQILGRKWMTDPSDLANAIVDTMFAMNDALKHYGIDDIRVFDSISGFYHGDMDLADITQPGAIRWGATVLDRSGTTQKALRNMNQIIMSFRGANASTAIHEFAHATINVMREVAVNLDHKNLQSDLSALDAWAVKTFKAAHPGVEPSAEMLNEIVAKGFEKYIYEKWLPAREVRPLFVRLKAALHNIYNKLKSYFFDVSLDDKVSKVFDRMMGENIKKKALEDLAEYHDFTEIPVGYAKDMANTLDTLRTVDDLDSAELWRGVTTLAPFMSEGHADSLQRYYDAWKNYKFSLTSGNDKMIQKATVAFNSAETKLRQGLGGVELARRRTESYFSQAEKETGLKFRREAAETPKDNPVEMPVPDVEPEWDEDMAINDIASASFRSVYGRSPDEAELSAFKDNMLRGIEEELADEASRPPADAPFTYGEILDNKVFGIPTYADDRVLRPQFVTEYRYNERGTKIPVNTHQWMMPEEAILHAAHLERTQVNLERSTAWRTRLMQQATDYVGRQKAVLELNHVTMSASEEQQAIFARFSELMQRENIDKSYTPMSLKEAIEVVKSGRGKYAVTNLDQDSMPEQTVYFPRTLRDKNAERGYEVGSFNVTDIETGRTSNYKSKGTYGRVTIDGVTYQVKYEGPWNQPDWNIYVKAERGTDIPLSQWETISVPEKATRKNQVYVSDMKRYTTSKTALIEDIQIKEHPVTKERVTVGMAVGDRGQKVPVILRPSNKKLVRGNWRVETKSTTMIPSRQTTEGAMRQMMRNQFVDPDRNMDNAVTWTFIRSASKDQFDMMMRDAGIEPGSGRYKYMEASRIRKLDELLSSPLYHDSVSPKVLVDYPELMQKYSATLDELRKATEKELKSPSAREVAEAGAIKPISARLSQIKRKDRVQYTSDKGELLNLEVLATRPHRGGLQVKFRDVDSDGLMTLVFPAKMETINGKQVINGYDLHELTKVDESNAARFSPVVDANTHTWKEFLRGQSDDISKARSSMIAALLLNDVEAKAVLLGKGKTPEAEELLKSVFAELKHGAAAKEVSADDRQLAHNIINAYRTDLIRLLQQEPDRIKFSDMNIFTMWLRGKGVSDSEIELLQIPDRMAGLHDITKSEAIEVLNKLEMPDDPDVMIDWQTVWRDRQSIEDTWNREKLDPMSSILNMNTDFMHWFRGSEAVTEYGTPRVMVHGTPYGGGFLSFDSNPAKGDWGIHVGTYEQANARVTAMRKSMQGVNFAETDQFVPVVLSVKSPLILEFDPLSFRSLPSRIMNYVEDFPGDPNGAELRKLAQEMLDSSTSFDAAKYDKWAEVLDRHGYDGIKYRNEVEGDSYSYMVWDPSRIKSVDNIGTWNPNSARVDWQQIDPSVMYDNMDDDTKAFWTTYINSTRVGPYRLVDVAKAFADEATFNEDDPNMVLAGMRTFLQTHANSDVRKVIEPLTNEMEYVVKYVKSVVDGKPIPPPFRPESTIDSAITGFVESKIFAATQLQKSLNALSGLKDNFRKVLDDGSYKELRDMPNTVKEVFRKVGDEASREQTDLIYKSLHGGDVNGQNLLDAVGETLRVMIDYQSSSQFDEYMRKIIPFWKYPSRSLPFWIKTMYRHPYLVSSYYRYMQYSENSAKQRGYVNSKGQQLPSLVGYVPIPGTDIWVNPTAPLIYRYVYPEQQWQNYDEEEDGDSIAIKSVRWILNESQARGFSLSPLWSWVFRDVINDPYGRGNIRYELGKVFLPIPAELIPPWMDRATLGKVSQLINPQDDGYFVPQVRWKDLLVERQLLWDAMAQAEKVTDVYKKREIFTRVATIVSDTDREQYPEWMKAVQEYEDDTYGHKAVAYFTGFYTKSVDQQYADVMQLRDQLNQLKASINNDISSYLFKLDRTAEDRNARFKQLRYDDPLGQAYDIYQKINFVVDPMTGKSLYGLDRRQRIADEYYEDAISQAYYDALKVVNEERDRKLANLGIPPSSEEVSSIWDEWSAARADIESQPMYAQAKRPWSTGIATYEQVEEHYADVFWRAVLQTKPVWNKENNETYDEYQVRVSAWESMLPVVARSVLPTVKITMDNDLARGARSAGYDYEGLLQRLMDTASVQGLDTWQKNRDSVYDALNEAWWAVYGRAYEPVFNSSGAERELLTRQFYEKYPTPPDFVTLYNQVKATYGNRFSYDLVWEAYTGREVYEIQQYYDQGQVNSQEKNAIWDILTRANLTPDGMTKLRKAFVEVGGNEDYITMWYDSGGNPEAWKDEGDFLSFYESLTTAADTVDLRELTTEELQERTEAETLNDQFKELVRSELGEGIDTLVAINAQLSYKDKKAWQTANPDKYALVKQYYTKKDEYAAINQLWAKYYWTSEYHGSDGAGASPKSTVSSYRSGYSYYSRIKKRKGKKRSSTSSSAAGMAGRTTTNVNSLLGSFNRR